MLLWLDYKLLPLSILRENRESLNQRQPHTIFLFIEPLMQLGRDLEATTDQRDDNHWAGDNKKHQIIHLIFLGFPKIVRIEKYKHKQ